MLLSLKFSEIIKQNSLLKEKVRTNKPYNISVLSNITTHQLNSILEFSLRSSGVNANVSSGDYDNIVQDSGKQEETDAVIIFWELSNIVDGLNYKADLMSDGELGDLISQVKSEITLTLNSLKNCPLVIFNEFSSLIFNSNKLSPNRLDSIRNELNAFVKSNLPKNVQLIALDKVISISSVTESADIRYFYSSKSLYSVLFYKNYVNYIHPIFASILGKAKKVLIFDCDNTLWKGIIGEDGMNGITMSSENKVGLPFSEVQHLALELYNQGVILAICSKNNSKEVDEVLESHPNMILKDEHFIVKKVNWEDKVSNIKEIATELNLGLDSFVFIDDSDFEVNLVKTQLPAVTVMQVPKKTHLYPALFRDCMNLFFHVSKSEEDKSKSKMYRDEILRVQEKNSITNIDDYIKSLKIELSFFVDEEDKIPRMAQMTQKTNQFNLTTIRYSENEIRTFLLDSNDRLIAMGAKDKFGEYGIIGLCILRMEASKQLAIIDTFLMSCRIIGRKVEFSFFDYIVELLRKESIKTIKASYIKTAKNNQVKDLYEKFGFEVLEKTENETNYSYTL